jgi:predicted DNA-binding transcriptional regulator AlpA
MVQDLLTQEVRRFVDGLMNIKDVCQLLRISCGTLRLWIKLGHFPKPISLGPKTPRWQRSVIETWLAKHREAMEAAHAPS